MKMESEPLEGSPRCGVELPDPVRNWAHRVSRSEMIQDRSNNKKYEKYRGIGKPLSDGCLTGQRTILVRLSPHRAGNHRSTHRTPADHGIGETEFPFHSSRQVGGKGTPFVKQIDFSQCLLDFLIYRFLRAFEFGKKTEMLLDG